MKVGQLYEASQLDATARAGTRPSRETPGGGASGAVGRPAADADRVELSEAVKVPGQGDDAIDPERVAALKKAIDEGKYHINVEKIAATMISQAAELVETLARVGRPPR